jgi:hypothetical protein
VSVQSVVGDDVGDVFMSEGFDAEFIDMEGASFYDEMDRSVHAAGVQRYVDLPYICKD